MNNFNQFDKAVLEMSKRISLTLEETSKVIHNQLFFEKIAFIFMFAILFIVIIIAIKKLKEYQKVQVIDYGLDEGANIAICLIILLFSIFIEIYISYMIMTIFFNPYYYITVFLF